MVWLLLWASDIVTPTHAREMCPCRYRKLVTATGEAESLFVGTKAAQGSSCGLRAWLACPALGLRGVKLKAVLSPSSAVTPTVGVTGSQDNFGGRGTPLESCQSRLCRAAQKKCGLPDVDEEDVQSRQPNHHHHHDSDG